MLSLAVPVAKSETTARGFPVILKIQDVWIFLTPPRLETNTVHENLVLYSGYLFFFSSRRTEFQFQGFLIGIFILS